MTNSERTSWDPGIRTKIQIFVQMIYCVIKIIKRKLQFWIILYNIYFYFFLDRKYQKRDENYRIMLCAILNES